MKVKGQKIIDKIACGVFGHLWKLTKFKRYDVVGGTNYYKCQRCAEVKTEWITEYL